MDGDETTEANRILASIEACTEQGKMTEIVKEALVFCTVSFPRKVYFYRHGILLFIKTELQTASTIATLRFALWKLMACFAKETRFKV